MLRLHMFIYRRFCFLVFRPLMTNGAHILGKVERIHTNVFPGVFDMRVNVLNIRYLVLEGIPTLKGIDGIVVPVLCDTALHVVIYRPFA